MVLSGSKASGGSQARAVAPAAGPPPPRCLPCPIGQWRTGGLLLAHRPPLAASFAGLAPARFWLRRRPCLRERCEISPRNPRDLLECGMPDSALLLALLAEDCVCSGSALGRVLGVSRAAVHKTIAQLVHQGITIESRRGEGYRLDPRFRPLELARLQSNPGFDVEVVTDTDSTNRELFRRLEAGQDIHACALLAEQQSAGVGRRGRMWRAAPYSNILLSCAWRFPRTSAQLAGLSLAVGVALHQACSDYGLPGLALKWPNDLVYGVAKIGGILLDVRGESEAPTVVVCGIGVNVHLPQSVGAGLDQPWSDLCRVLGTVVDRSALVGLLLQRLYDVFVEFESSGFGETLLTAWERRHRDQGQEVLVQAADGRVQAGRALGLAADGGLRVRYPEGVRVLYSGDVRVRPTGTAATKLQRDA